MQFTQVDGSQEH